jgi:hypothetical protein
MNLRSNQNHSSSSENNKLFSLDVNFDPPTVEEILEASNKLKNNKTCRNFRIRAEMIKQSVPSLGSKMADLFAIMSSPEKVPLAFGMELCA